VQLLELGGNSPPWLRAWFRAQSVTSELRVTQQYSLLTSVRVP